MKKIIYICASLLVFTSCNYKQEETNNTIRKNISNEYLFANIYTTAENTSLKLSATDTLALEKAKQPLETEIFIAINPEIEFQTFLGIGGAITDASAEVFAKLSPDKQREFLNAY